MYHFRKMNNALIRINFVIEMFISKKWIEKNLLKKISWMNKKICYICLRKNKKKIMENYQKSISQKAIGIQCRIRKLNAFWKSRKKNACVVNAIVWFQEYSNPQQIVSNNVERKRHDKAEMNARIDNNRQKE